jgi:hypothetical protein
MSRSKPVQRERGEQQAGVMVLTSLGAKPYVLGTTRSKWCHVCGVMTKDFSTRQTPGISDVYAILPKPRYPPIVPKGRLLWWEAKAPKGRASKEQEEFRALVLEAGGDHVLGTLDALFAFLIDGGWLLERNVPHYRRPAHV